MNVRSNLLLTLLMLCICTSSPRTSNADQDSEGRDRCEKSLTVKVVNVDMSKADGYAVTDFDLFLKALKKLKLKSDKILLRGFDGSRLEKLLNEGSDRKSKNSTYAYTLEEIEKNEVYGDDLSIFVIAYENQIPAIAIYDSSQLIHLTGWQYKFASPENKRSALLAVLLLGN